MVKLAPSVFLASLLCSVVCPLWAQSQTPCEDPEFLPYNETPFSTRRALHFSRRFSRGSSFSIQSAVAQFHDKWVIYQLNLTDYRPKQVADLKTIYSGSESGIGAAVDTLCGPGHYNNSLSAPTGQATSPGGKKLAAAPLAIAPTGNAVPAMQAAQSSLRVDLNNDGIPDSVTLFPDGSVRIALFAAGGTVVSTSVARGGANPNLIAAGDFNGDGKIDIAVVNGGVSTQASPDQGSVSILLGNGDGTFKPALTVPAGNRPSSQHHQRRIPFRRAVGLEHLRVHDQPIAVLGQKIAVVAEPGFLAVALSRQQSIGIRGGRVSSFAPFLPVEVHGGIAGIVRGRILFLILGLKALQACPCFDQRSIHREMLIAGHAFGLCLGNHFRGDAQTPEIVRDKLFDLTRRRIESPTDQILWSEMTRWTIEATLEFADGPIVRMFADGGHTYLIDEGGKQRFFESLPTSSNVASYI